MTTWRRSVTRGREPGTMNDKTIKDQPRKKRGFYSDRANLMAAICILGSSTIVIVVLSAFGVYEAVSDALHLSPDSVPSYRPPLFVIVGMLNAYLIYLYIDYRLMMHRRDKASGARLTVRPYDVLVAVLGGVGVGVEFARWVVHGPDPYISLVTGLFMFAMVAVVFPSALRHRVMDARKAVADRRARRAGRNGG